MGTHVQWDLPLTNPKDHAEQTVLIQPVNFIICRLIKTERFLHPLGVTQLEKGRARN